MDYPILERYQDACDQSHQGNDQPIETLIKEVDQHELVNEIHHLVNRICHLGYPPSEAQKASDLLDLLKDAINRQALRR